MPEILVEFVPDFSKLKTGVDTLVDEKKISKDIAAMFVDANKTIDQFGAKFAQLGEPIKKALTPAINQAKKNIKDLSTSGIKDLGELKKRVDGITKSFTDGFGEGVKQALDEAGVSMEEFTNQLTKATAVDKSLKQELREITEQLALMKLRGEENTQQYQELSVKAGQYRDALRDVTEEINRTASDTRKLDTVLEFVTGLSASFAVLQGVQALAGEENEELQKTLLKVNAAMSILIGLQQIQNLLQKESNIMRFISNAQQRIQITLTSLETAAQSKNIIVKGAATVATRALNAAMNANPALLLVSAFAALAGAISFFTGKTKEAKDIVGDFNSELERTNQILERTVEKIDEETQTQINLAKQRGASEEEITKITLDGIARRADAQQKEFDARVSGFKKTLEEMGKLSGGTDISFLAAPNLGISVEEFNRLTRQGVNNVDEALNLLNKVKAVRVTDVWKGFSEESKKNNDLIIAMLESIITSGKNIEGLGKQADDIRAEQAKKRLDDAKAAAEDAKRKAEEQRRIAAENLQKGFEDFVAKQKLRLLRVEKDSEDELNVRRDILRAELQLALNNDKLTFNQRKLLIQQFFADERELRESFQREVKRRTLEDAISNINAELNALRLSFEEREELTISLLNKQRELELSQVVNNKTKEKEINARFDKEIMEQRKAIRKAAFDEELAEIQRNAFIARRRAEEASADEGSTFPERKKALEELYNFEFGLITRKRLENQQLFRDNLLSAEEYTAASKDLSNEEFEARQKFEKSYTAIVKSEAEKRRETFMKTVQDIADLANQLADSVRSFLETMANIEDQRIEAHKDNLLRLREGNAITEKEFITRMKNVEKVEREAKQRQAVREKSLALFEAFINGATAIIKAADNPFQLAVTIALVTAQIAAIASRPIPKFGKGVKSAPKGLAEVGETGAEIIKTDKGYYVAEHPQLVWFKGGERVYNPQETSEIMETPQANMTIINNTSSSSVNGSSLDYDKLAKKLGAEIEKHPRNIISLDEDGFSVHIMQKNNIKKYLNKRFTFND